MHARTKNPAAIILGRLGGLARNPRKGFGTPAVQIRAQAARKANKKKLSISVDGCATVAYKGRQK
jgi:hypothetical protein